MGATRPARMAMTVITTRSSMSVKPAPLRFGDTQHLFDSREARLHFAPAVLPERHHSLPLRELADRARVRRLEEFAFDLLGQNEELENPGAAPVPGLAARRTTVPALEGHLADRLLGEERYGPRIGLVPRATVGAHLPNQPLRHAAFDPRADQFS